MKKFVIFAVFVLVFIMSACSSNDIDTSGYSEIGTLEGYDIYYTNTATCIEELRVTDATIWITYDYSCSGKIDSNVYVAIKDGEQHDLLELVEDGTFDMEDLDNLIEVKYFYPG
jgi:hypothetical protein